MSFVSKALSYLNPKTIEIAGLALIGVGAGLIGGRARIEIAALLAIYLLDRIRPTFFNFIGKFATPSTWPGYVALGIASVIAAQHGGSIGTEIVAGALTVGVGRLFHQLY